MQFQSAQQWYHNQQWRKLHGPPILGMQLTGTQLRSDAYKDQIPSCSCKRNHRRTLGYMGLRSTGVPGEERLAPRGSRGAAPHTSCHTQEMFWGQERLRTTSLAFGKPSKGGKIITFGFRPSIPPGSSGLGEPFLRNRPIPSWFRDSASYTVSPGCHPIMSWLQSKLQICYSPSF